MGVFQNFIPRFCRIFEKAHVVIRHDGNARIVTVSIFLENTPVKNEEVINTTVSVRNIDNVKAWEKVFMIILAIILAISPAMDAAKISSGGA